MSDEEKRRRPLPATVESDDDELATVRHDRGDDAGAAASVGDARAPTNSERYAAISLLGAGGMGEVHLCSDRVIGRDVAMKVMRRAEDIGSRGEARFVREALVQARLEHPSVVPVYDVGISRDGPAWFTMKRVRGRTLDSILAGLSERDESTLARFSQRKLLDALARVCLAVDYAHERGVVHRDLKPANIMLGDFGEVNVLDWGLAKVFDQDAEREESLSDLWSADAEPTMIGSLLGTPGYMSPEQARGALRTIGARSDVYSLGAMLYEIVTLHPFNRAQGSVPLLAATMNGVDPRPPEGVEAPPELEKLWTHATALDPADRLASARELADALERYLDGDRDVTRRREIAAAHLATAHARLSERADRETLDETTRAAALRELARAVALDPSNAVALELMGTLLLDAPPEVPPEAFEELERAKQSSRHAAAQTAARRYLMWGAFVPLALMMGIRDWTVTGVGIALIALAGIDALRLAARPRIRFRHGIVLLALSSLAIAMLSALFGPFVLVPGLAATNSMFFAMNTERRHRAWIIVAGVLAVVGPWAVEAVGLVPSAYRFDASGFGLVERAAYFPETATIVCLLLTSAAMVVIPAMMVARMRDALARAEQRLFLQAWRLRQMLPVSTRDAISGEVRTPPVSS
ncbi:MAG: serine/threonine protein kinase [Myxococcota bacterium]|nr:serine/threonine protein kinase [Myxococcota bacterium]